MQVIRNDKFTFSWEWFIVDSESHATKLQEIGELAITVSRVGPGWEVTRTEFLSDVSFRVIPFPKGDPKNPTWRVKIFKGSIITWPSIVKGNAASFRRCKYL